jgi:hypothetical protein
MCVTVSIYSMQVGHIEGHINPSSVRQLMFHGSVLQHALVIAVQATLVALTVSAKLPLLMVLHHSFKTSVDYCEMD